VQCIVDKKKSRNNFLKTNDVVGGIPLLLLAACTGGSGAGGPSGGPTTPTPAAPNSADPTDIALSFTSIAENISATTSIGVITTSDSDSSNHVYTVSDDRFEVVNDELRLKSGNSLNYEASDTIYITINVSDTEGGSYSELISISVIDEVDIVPAQGITIFGEDSGDLSGWSVSLAGDVNNDGFDDLIIGARNADPIGKSNAGKSYVVFGSANIFDENINLTNINGANGFSVNGKVSDDWSGTSVSNLGDINGDSIDDFIIGAFGADPGGVERAGESYVIFGSDGVWNSEMDLSSLNGNNGFSVIGTGFAGVSGWPVSNAGDINGDGLNDIVIASYGANNGSIDAAGNVYVIYGSNIAFPAEFDPNDLTGNNGFTIVGGGIADHIGADVAFAGDLNGDGIDDLVIGALHTGSPVKQQYIVFGSDSGFDSVFNLDNLNGNNGVTLEGSNFGSSSTIAVSAVGDFNGDGYDDTLIGSYLSDVGLYDSAGESYLIFGHGGSWDSVIGLDDLNENEGVVFMGGSANSQTGVSVSGAGDLNGDGFDDIIIGSSNLGKSYVVFGGNSYNSATFDLSSLDGEHGFVVQGVDFGDNSGYSVSDAGDINNDGFDDIVIGAYFADGAGNAEENSGESYLIFGHGGNWDPILDLSNLKPYFQQEGTERNDIFNATTNEETFVMMHLNWGDDIIFGFDDGQDKIDLTDTNLLFGDLSIVQNGSDVLITEANGNSITLDTLLVSDVSAADFLF
tara:strand:- start:32597 stop:34816 length:2220 start_codon:yes stop_codon:yes gene_type:complete